MLKYFSKQLFTLIGSVVGAGIEVTMALHLCYVFQYFHHGFVPLLHDGKENLMPLNPLLSAHAPYDSIFEACASLVICSFNAVVILSESLSVFIIFF
jgi:hypothetical protein